MTDPARILETGQTILEAVFRKHGFTFEAGLSSRSSGGTFARGSFVRGERRMDFSVRFSLGLVYYRVGDVALPHGDYIMAVSGAPGRYPGYSDNPLNAFHDLADDLSRHGDVFLRGTPQQFHELVERASNRPRGLGRLPD